MAHTLFFDGASKSNPGRAGCASVIYSPDGTEMLSVRKDLGTATNNEAEYSGLILGLAQAIKEGVTRLIVKGDSMLVISQMQGQWKVKANNLIAKHAEALELSKLFVDCTFVHVPRAQNSRADKLSNLAITE
jgi:ribonuclease HI